MHLDLTLQKENSSCLFNDIYDAKHARVTSFNCPYQTPTASKQMELH